MSYVDRRRGLPHPQTLVRLELFEEELVLACVLDMTEEGHCRAKSRLRASPQSPVDDKMWRPTVCSADPNILRRFWTWCRLPVPRCVDREVVRHVHYRALTLCTAA